MNGRDDATIRRTLVDHAGGAPLATLVSELRLATSGWECDPDVANALAAVRKLGADVHTDETATIGTAEHVAEVLASSLETIVAGLPEASA